MQFKLQSNFHPRGDQPSAIEGLLNGLKKGLHHQSLLGVTGSGKTYTMAKIIESMQRPTLIISPNKTLAAQLYQEFKEFFPDNEVHYFVSYYDYYQPEAYLPHTDTYIAKDAQINEDLDKFRHSATQALLSRQDVIVVASVSCIYNIGSPQEYQDLSMKIKVGQAISFKDFLTNLIALQYVRNEIERAHGTFRYKGSVVEIYPSTGEKVLQVEFEKNSICMIKESKNMIEFDYKEVSETPIYPAKYWVASRDAVKRAMNNIRAELASRLAELKKEKKFLEAERLEFRTSNDLAMLEKTGYCHGIENYSAQMEFRPSGSAPYTLLDYFNYIAKDKHVPFLCFLDESHLAIPQIRGMWHGERARKEVLIQYGWRLPSAMDNRPLRFEEFDERVLNRIYVSATLGPYEIEKSELIVEQLVRPTGLLDPKIEVRSTQNQIPNLLKEIESRVAKKERVLVSAITKKLSEELTTYLQEKGIKVQYLHSEVKTLDRSDILKDLREGKYDVLVGVNLLREGLDLPEVSLVAILDADKEGFLRNRTTLIQLSGRAARHINGLVIFYADHVTDAMRFTIQETERRRLIQQSYNEREGIVPMQIQKPVRESLLARKKEQDSDSASSFDFSIPPHLILQGPNGKKVLSQLKKEMKQAATDLDFEKAAKIRDYLKRLKS